MTSRAFWANLVVGVLLFMVLVLHMTKDPTFILWVALRVLSAAFL